MEFAKQDNMPPDLCIPIAAKSIAAIDKYIGNCSKISAKSDNALLVTLDNDIHIPKKSSIWKTKESDILYYAKQVWVHVNYSSYRNAYHKVFPDTDLKLVIDHVMNRRVARLKGFEYLRVIPISREANSSSGNITEKYGFDANRSDPIRNLNNLASLHYADIADIVKMLNIKTGGSFQDGIRDSLKYFFEE